MINQIISPYLLPYNHLEEKIKQETFSAKHDKFRPATKEEVLALLVKE